MDLLLGQGRPGHTLARDGVTTATMPERRLLDGGPPEDGTVLGEIASLRREQKLIWNAHAREHEQHELAHGREHAFSQTAIDKAAEMAKENKADANEWRGSMSDREAKFATKADIASLAEKLDRLDDSATRGADAKFATKADVRALGDKIDKLEEAEIRRAENERLRLIADAEDKRQTERRQSRQQWTVGLIVGLVATFGAILVNAVIRLVTQ